MSGAAFWLQEGVLDIQMGRRGGSRPSGVRWGGIALTVIAALLLGGTAGAAGRHYLNAKVASPPPLAGVTAVRAQPIPTIGVGTVAPPRVLPSRILLQVPFTTQAPLNDWAAHQESCEAANLTMLYLYWKQDRAVVIDPHAADGFIRTIDGWKPRPDLNDRMTGELAAAHWGFTYRILPNTRQVIAEQLSAGRPLLAEVRTHGLGNAHYPGYYSHYEQTGWSVPHFVLIIGYDSTGVWLNDPGISWGRGYHITYAQLAHAIDDLDRHHPALAQGQVLLLIAPEVQPRIGTGIF